MTYIIGRMWRTIEVSRYLIKSFSNFRLDTIVSMGDHKNRLDAWGIVKIFCGGNGEKKKQEKNFVMIID